MKWFRRELDDFGPFDWDDSKPLFPRVAPEPWRTFPGPKFLIPLDLVLTFADRNRLANILRTEQEYVFGLADSIDMEGLTTPPTMVYDDAGKIRYHDGYHRLAATLALKYFDSLPVCLVKSPYVRGYGRLVSEEVPMIFQLFAVNADSTSRSSKKMVLRP